MKRPGDDLTDRDSRRATRELKTLGDGLADLREQLSNTRQQLADQLVQNAELVAERDRAKGQIDGLSSTLAEAQQALSEKSEEIEKLKESLKKKNSKLKDLVSMGISLQEALSTKKNRDTYLIPALVVCLGAGAAATAKAESKRPHAMDYGTIGDYTDGGFIERISKGNNSSDENSLDDSMGFFTQLLTAMIHRGHQNFSPASKDFEGSSSSNDSGSAVSRALTGSDRYMLKVQRTVATCSALVLNCVDYFYSWEYGWLLALETRKLAQSERLNLLLSKSLPMPTSVTLIRELERQVKDRKLEAKKSSKDWRALVLDTFDNISSWFGYQMHTSRAGKGQSAKPNPVATAWSKWIFTLTDAGVEALKKLQGTTRPINPFRRSSNSPEHSNTENVPEKYWEPTEKETALVEAECKFSLSTTFKLMVESKEIELSPPKESKAVSTVTCVFCGTVWPASKRKCQDDSKGCGGRIRGVKEETTGEAKFADDIDRKYRPTLSIINKTTGTAFTRSVDSMSVDSTVPDNLDWFQVQEDIQFVLPGNPGAKSFNDHVIETIGMSNNLKGFVDNDKAENSLGFVCSDGGADFMEGRGVGDFGPHSNLVSVIASGHEEMNMIKALLKIAFHMGGGALAEIHEWRTVKAKQTLMSGCDTHKAIDFLLEVCRKSFEATIWHEWIQFVQTSDNDTAHRRGSVEEMWIWCSNSTDASFKNHFHFWIKSLGALALLRKAVRNHENNCHEQYRAAQKFLLPYFFALGSYKWGPLVMRDMRIIDFLFTEEIRQVYKEMFRMSSQGFDFWEEESVREIGRNMLHSASQLSFDIGCLARANGPHCSAALSGICGIVHRGKQDRTATAYDLDVESCVEYLLGHRKMEQVPNRGKILTIDMKSIEVELAESPLGLWEYGKAGISTFVQTKKFPKNKLPHKKINGFKNINDEEDDDENEDGA